MAGQMVMQDRKTEQVTVRVYEGLHERMKALTPEGSNVGHTWSKAAEVFLDLPEPLQDQILSGKIRLPFVEIVQQIVDRRIAEGKAAAEKLLGPQPRKPNRKD